jgi:molecular chaperone GrpE
MAERSEKGPAGAADELAATSKQQTDEVAEVAEVAESPETADGAERVEGDLEALLEDVRRERDEYLDLARRAKADFENYRKRAAQQTTDAAKRAKADLARELLPAIDSLERALAGADTGGDALAKGVSLVRDELVATLARAGVEVYDPAGERFDPTWHEALSTMPASEGVESGIVIETVDRGYRLDGQVLRPARVVVSE